MDITHTAVSDLEITLISPSGKRSTLSEFHLNSIGDDTNFSWTYMSVHHWGEDSQGQWTVEIKDLGADDTGTLNAVSVELHGVPVAAASRAPFITGAASVPAFVGKPFFYQISTEGSPSSYAVSGLPAGVFLDETGTLSGIPTSTGQYTIDLSATGIGGIATGRLVIDVVSDTKADVANAIDWDGRGLNHSGSIHWSHQDVESSDKVDAASTGGLGDNEFSSLSAEVSVVPDGVEVEFGKGGAFAAGGNEGDFQIGNCCVGDIHADLHVLGPEVSFAGENQNCG